MSEESEDFLTTRLNDILIIENDDVNYQEEAVPWKCWGRGGARPSLSKLNFQKFLEVSERNSATKSRKMKIDCSNIMLPVPSKDNSIMENIASECYSVFGSATTDKHIADWLQQNFSEATENKDNDTHPKENFPKLSLTSYNFLKRTNKSVQLTNSDFEGDITDKTESTTDKSSNTLYESSEANNSNVQDENTTSQIFVLKRKSIDHVHKDNIHNALHQSLSSNKQCSNKLPPDLTSFERKTLRCIPNRNNSFTIENLPNYVTRNEMKQVLSSFGTVENIVIRESEGNITASIRMGAECNCPWIIGCLNGSQPFGVPPHVADNPEMDNIM